VNKIQDGQIISKEYLRYSLLSLGSLVLGIMGLIYGYLYPIGFVTGAVFLLVVIKKPFWGFLAYIAIVYLRPAELFPMLEKIKFQAFIFKARENRYSWCLGK